MKTIIYNGRLVGISEDAGVLYSGTYEISDDKYLVADGRENSSTTYKLYDIYNENNFFSIGLVTAHIEEKNRFSGGFQNDAGQEGELDSYYSSLYDKAVSISDIYGSRHNDDMSISIDDSGFFTGTYSGCVIDGSFSIPQAGKNMFAIKFDLSECSTAGTYDGLGIIMADDFDLPYFMGLASNETRMEAIGFILDELPKSFITKTRKSKTIVKYANPKPRMSFAGNIDNLPADSGVHDNEVYTDTNMAYRFLEASYIGASFIRTKMFKVEKAESPCLGWFSVGTCTSDIYYTSYIKDSNFSGALFDQVDFGSSYQDFISSASYYTVIKDSDFSSSSFISQQQDSIDQNKFLYIKPYGTNFNGSVFQSYKFTINTDGNNFSNSNFMNTVLNLETNDIDITGSMFRESSVTFNNITNVQRVVFHDTKVTIKTSSFDFTGADISELSELNLFETIDVSGYDLSNIDIVFNANDNVLGGFTAGYKGGSFVGTDFRGSTLSMGLHKVVTENNNGAVSYYTGITAYDTDFSKADFSGANFVNTTYDNGYKTVTAPPAFTNCDFTGADFSGADMGTSEFYFSKLNYVNLEGADYVDKSGGSLKTITSYFGNAWWFDGTRCAAISIGTCIPSPFDTGLSYAEYLSGKGELDKAAENIKKEVVDAIDKGKSFIEDTGGSVIKKIFRW
jgi:uncharacterized protein YjbI with pentapeptide repeats